MSVVSGSSALTPGPDDEARRKADEERLRALHLAEYHRFFEVSHHIAERVLRARWAHRETVQDALQDAYLQALVRWEKVRVHENPIAWVITTARYRIFHAYKKTQREAATAPDELPAVSEADVADVWRVQDSLRTWLQQIRPTHAEVFQMSHEGFTDREIAMTLGIAERSVQCYRAAARKRLRELAERDGFTTSDRDDREGDDRGPR
ncbi:RNA polymerase sigma factor [Actinoplanes sp. LDG1-06]|uniref:RNA polymerase sigma factor n=1 Tax=Paractinoplanes ovalisporus TaxID=2810368 RepID=A0ABS2AHV7_9ACTN|nr:RNA polymerase sigma factor [Actinoplanes ovalisporus]MBM2618801.1 RNA polymerase sigma factor [Actinoplanes ovalisporus]